MDNVCQIRQLISENAELHSDIKAEHLKVLHYATRMNDEIDKKKEISAINKTLIHNQKQFESDIKAKDLAIFHYAGYHNQILYEKGILQNTLNGFVTRYHQKLLNSDCKSWYTQDIVMWIVNLNKMEYVKYGDKLLMNMTRERIDGSCFRNLNVNDLYRYGIGYKHGIDIYGAVQRLVGNEKRNNECLVCMDAPRDYACIPCGHLCLCGKCKDNIDRKCPICRKKYDSICN